MKEAQAKNIYLKDYQAPDFYIEETDLNVCLFEDESFVEARLKIKRNPSSNNPNAALQLNGKELELLELRLNGKILLKSEFRQDDETLCNQAAGEHQP